MTPHQFRRLATGFPEAQESAHMGHPDFRVRGRIFATLGYPNDRHGMVKLTPEQQADVVESDAKSAFSPAAGAWGRRGATTIELKTASPELVRVALELAWRNIAPRSLVREIEIAAKLPAKKTSKKPDRREDGIPASFAPVAAAFAGDSRVSRKRMFSSENVLAVDGKIFAMLWSDKLVVKLPKPRVDELVGAGIGKNFDPGHGRLMKEWVVVGPGASWVDLAKEALGFVASGAAPDAARKRKR